MSQTALILLLFVGSIGLAFIGWYIYNWYKKNRNDQLPISHNESDSVTYRQDDNAQSSSSYQISIFPASNVVPITDQDTFDCRNALCTEPVVKPKLFASTILDLTWSQPYDLGEAVSRLKLQEVNSHIFPKSNLVSPLPSIYTVPFRSLPLASVTSFSDQNDVLTVDLTLSSKRLEDIVFIEDSIWNLDLHGMTVQEAKTIVIGFLKLHLDQGTSKIKIITGRGIHSVNGIAKIKPVIKNILLKECLTHEEVGCGGAFLVYLCG